MTFNSMGGSFNCYAYALNEPRLGFAEPGMLAEPGSLPNVSPAREFQRRLMMDGLIKLSHRDTLDPARMHIIAAWVEEQGAGFHFLRLDGDGRWSHKLGGDAPGNTDCSGVTATSQWSLVDRDSLKFISYYRVPDEGIDVRHVLFIPDKTLHAHDHQPQAQRPARQTPA